MSQNEGRFSCWYEVPSAVLAGPSWHVGVGNRGWSGGDGTSAVLPGNTSVGDRSGSGTDTITKSVDKELYSFDFFNGSICVL